VVSDPDERRVELAIREWVHESSLNRCNAGSDTCESWPVVDAIMVYVRPILAARGSVSLPNEENLELVRLVQVKLDLEKEIRELERRLRERDADVSSLKAALRDLVAMLPSSSAPAAKRARALVAAPSRPEETRPRSSFGSGTTRATVTARFRTGACSRLVSRLLVQGETTRRWSG
jgi:hypothetical protein